MGCGGTTPAALGGSAYHTLRHTFASRLVMAGVDLLTVKALGGWNRMEMVERYAHLAPAHKREAVEALARGQRLQLSGTERGTTQGREKAAVGGSAV